MHAPEEPPALVPTDDEDLLAGPSPAAPALTDAERIALITTEIAAGFADLAGVGPAVSIFGSARTPPDHADYGRATEVARRLGSAGFAVITGGGPGIMAAANQGARAAGALSIGLNIDVPREQAPNPHLDLLVSFRHFFVRRLMFVRSASAFVVHPGGFGTLDELFEALTLIQTGKIRHFPVVLVGRDHWSPLLEWIRLALVDRGFLSAADAALLHLADTADEVLDHVLAGVDDRAARASDGPPDPPPAVEIGVGPGQE